MFGSQGIFAEFSERWGKSERHGATTVTQDGDVAMAGEERMKMGEEEKEARREAKRVTSVGEGSESGEESKTFSSSEPGSR